MSEPPTPTIPTEIVDHILGFLHSDRDYDSLKTCSEIFPQLVDRHLYSRITLCTDPKADECNDSEGTYAVDIGQLFSFVILCPEAAIYVRFICIIISHQLLVQPEVISLILSKLPRIESIALHPPLLWFSVDRMFRKAIHKIIGSPSIKEVVISHIQSFSLNIFHDCKNLRRLVLNGQLFAGGEVVSELPRLRFLHVEAQTDVVVMTRIVSWIRGCTLQSLSLRVARPMDPLQFRSLMEACSATLVNLELEYTFTRPIPHFPELHLPLLERLVIRSRCVIHNLTHSTLPLLSPSSIPRRPIRLCLYLRFLRVESPLSSHDWSDISAFLALPVFLHPIEFYVTVKNGLTPYGTEDLITSFKQNSDLNCLFESGKVDIITSQP